VPTTSGNSSGQANQKIDAASERIRGLRRERDDALKEGDVAPDHVLPADIDALAIDVPERSTIEDDARAAADRESVNISETGPAALGQLGSTAAQDTGACQLLRLPAELHLRAVESTWAGQGGSWMSSSGVVLSSFKLWFISTTWDTAYNRDLNMQAAFRGVVTSDEELEYSYGWTAKRSPMAYPGIASLEDAWWSAIYRGAYSSLLSPEQKYGNASNASVWHTTALVDCEGNLLYVVKLLQQEDTTLPGGIDVYDSTGALATHAMVDYSIARYQFVDLSGNLIATAEAPGVGMGISLKDLKPDPSLGYILPYGVEFQKTGYANASRLLDMDYRWVIAAAVQARALDDAHHDWQPWAPLLLVAMGCLLGALLLVLICCACGAMYRLVYPRDDAEKLPPLLDKRGQPHFYTVPNLTVKNRQ